MYRISALSSLNDGQGENLEKIAFKITYEAADRMPDQPSSPRKRWLRTLAPLAVRMNAPGLVGV
jgi:hypothetical protein